jgi:hypothetical protein
MTVQGTETPGSEIAAAPRKGPPPLSLRSVHVHPLGVDDLWRAISRFLDLE